MYYIRPMKGKRFVDENETEFVKHGLDPQVYWIKKNNLSELSNFKGCNLLLQN